MDGVADPIRRAANGTPGNGAFRRPNGGYFHPEVRVPAPPIWRCTTSPGEIPTVDNRVTAGVTGHRWHGA